MIDHRPIDTVLPMKNENNTIQLQTFLQIKIEMYSIDFRKAVIQLYSYFKSMRKTAIALNISVASISRWTKRIDPKQYTRRQVKTSEALVSFILTQLSQKPYLTCKEICEMIHSKFSFEVSRQLVHLILKKNNISFQ